MRGNSGSEPPKTLDVQGLATGGQRWRFIPLHKRLSSTSARPAALPSADYALNLDGVAPDDTNFSHFAATLAQQSDDNITASFAQYVQVVRPLSLSLPLLYRNRTRLVDASLDALSESVLHGGEATPAVAVCLAALVNDLGGDAVDPFFAPIVAAFARILHDSNQTGAVGTSAPTTCNLTPRTEVERNRQHHSLFWEPEVALVPIFTALSQITKALLPRLVTRPAQTVTDLTPLLAHAHYRVREMTAEACLGYVVRKTREASVRDAIVEAVIDAARRLALSGDGDNATVSETVVSATALADGLGVALFEAVRLPSGRLHSRAGAVLRVAFRCVSMRGDDGLIETQPPVSHRDDRSAAVDGGLAVVCRCFASLCRYITAVADAQATASLLMSECGDAVSAADDTHVSNLLFIIGKWIHYGGRTLVNLMGIPLCQRLLNLIVHAVDATESPSMRLVCESLHAICSIHRHTTEAFREKSVRSAMASVLERVAKLSDPLTLTASVRILLDARCVELSRSSHKRLSKGVAAVCDRLASVDEHDGVENGANDQVVSSSALALAVRYLRALSDGTAGAERECHAFFAPTLERKVLAILDKATPSFDDASALDRETVPDQFEAVLDYLSLVCVEGCNALLSQRVKECGNWSMKTCAVFLKTCARQVGPEESTSDDLSAVVRVIIRDALLVDEEAWQSPSVCSSVSRCVQVFKLDFMSAIGVDETQRGPGLVLSLSQVRFALMRNLSAEDLELRQSSLSLLISLGDVGEEGSSDGRTTRDVETHHEGDEAAEVAIRAIRGALLSKLSLPMLCPALLCMTQVTRSLDGIGSRLLLLQELSRVVSHAKGLDDEVVCLLTHFTLGLFRMPLKTLWKPARDLLCAVTSHDVDVVMSATLSCLTSCQASILEEQRRAETKAVPDDDKGEAAHDDRDNGGHDGTEDKDEEEGGDGQDVPVDEPNGVPLSSNGQKLKRRMKKSKPFIMSKRQRSKEREATRLHWDILQWRKHCEERWLSNLDRSVVAGRQNSSVEGCTDPLTFAIEILGAMAKEPKYTLKVRQPIISLYLKLPLAMFGRNRGNALASSFSTLLEKMGGLKCCETNKDTETKMRDRLLSDLSRAAPMLQSSVFKCLCASRSDYLKRYRESFLRLIDESTFRDELAAVTETHFAEWSMSEETVFTVQQEAVIDVLVRICFSKLTGGKGAVDSRKTVVLSFLTSKLPWNVSLPRITSLLVDPMKMRIAELENSVSEDSEASGEMPPVAVQRGVLSSIEAVVKHCRRTLPAACWSRLAFAVLLLIQKAGVGTGGQNVRAKSLQLLSTMIELRPDDTASVTSRVLASMYSKIGDSGGSGVNGTPALLSFVSSLFNTLPFDKVDTIFEKHVWTMQFTLRVMLSPKSDVKTITLSSNILHGFISHVQRQMKDKSALQVSDDIQNGVLSVMENTAIMCVTLVPRLTYVMDGHRGEQKKWAKAFGALLEVVEHSLGVWPSSWNKLKDLVPVLSSFLQNSSIVFVPPSMSLTVLTAIVRTAVNVGGAESETYGIEISELLPLLSIRRFLRDGVSYTCLCRLIAVVGGDDLVSVSNVLTLMNAMNASKLGEPDLDERLAGLSVVTEAFKNGLGGSDRMSSTDLVDVVLKNPDETTGQAVSLGVDAVVALIHGCLASVYCNDIAVRGTAGYALKLIARWIGFSEKSNVLSAKAVLLGILLNAVVSSKNLWHRREFCIALGELVRSSDVILEDQNADAAVLFKHFKSLTNPSDPDADFFENLVHLQAHRRGRALRQLEKHLSESSNGDGDGNVQSGLDVFASSFVMPLGIRMALEKTNMDETKRGKNVRHFSAKEDAQKDVGSWAVGVIGVVSSMVGWEQYRSCLDGLLARVALQREEDDPVIVYKLLVRVAEGFPKQGDARYPAGNVAIDYLVDTLLPKMLPHVSSGAMTDDLVHQNERSSIRTVEVGGRRDKGQSSFRAPVAIAMGQLMAQLPEQNLETLMPLLVTPLTAALRSRMVSTRESAKHALRSVVLALGPKYLSYVLRQVFSVLQEGFRKEVCIYVIHTLLLGIREFRNTKSGGEPAVFEVDGCVNLLVTHMLAELRGGASESRKDFEDPNASDTRLRQASARASKACECAELLAELISFKTSVEALCIPFLEASNRTRSGKLLNRLADLLQRLLLGLNRNKSLSVPDAFKFCYELVADDDEDTGGSDVESAAVGKKVGVVLLPKVRQVRWCTFGLQFLNSVLAKNGNLLSERSDKGRLLHSMSGPFLALSVAALKTGQDELTLTAFRVLQKLLKLPLPGRAAVADELSSIVVDVLSSHSNGVEGDLSTTSELFNTCLRAAAVLLKEVGGENFDLVPKDRIDTLLGISCNCIENGSVDCRSAAVSLIRSVVASKVVLPSVYDMMEKVNELAIHSQSTSLQSACIAVSVMFLLTFPMGAKRTRQHLEFFVRNVNYELPSGRMAALRAIRELIAKFPAEVLEREGEYLFVALTATVARDSDADCRNMAYGCVKLLFERLPSGRTVVDLLKLGVALIGVQCSITSARQPPIVAGQVDATVLRCGCTSLSAACSSGRLSPVQLKLVVWSVLVAMEDVDADEDWETSHALLSCLDVAFKQQVFTDVSAGRLERQSFMRALWEKITTFLLNRNQWVRLVAARLVGSHLSACGGKNATPGFAEGGERKISRLPVEGTLSGSVDGWCVWDRNEVVRGWVKAFCLQLEADQLAIDLGQQCLKNVLCMADVVRKHPQAGDVGPGEAEDSAVKEDDVDSGKATEEHSRTVRWLLSRFCGLAVRGGREPQDMLRRACALRFLLVTATWWGHDIVSVFKRHYVLPVVQVLESGDLKVEEVVDDEAGNGKWRRNRRWNEREHGEETCSGGGEENEEGVAMQGLGMIAESLQSKLVECMGSDEYYMVYHELQSRKTKLKAERKRKAAMLAAVDPERAAKKKRMKTAIRKLRKRGVDSEKARQRVMEKDNERNGGAAADDETGVQQVVESQRQTRMLTEDL